MGKAKKFFMYLILTVASILSVFPLYYMFCASTNRSIDVIAGKLIPGTYLIDNFKALIAQQNLRLALCNSFRNATVLTILCLLVCSIAGYGFEIYHDKAKDAVFTVLLTAMMIPFAAIMIPMFRMFSQLKMVNTMAAFMLPSISTPFMIMMFRQASRSFPHDIIEAAKAINAGGVEIVAVSLGADGSLAVGEEGIFRAIVPKIDAVNTVGCGDSMIAGFALGLSEGLSLEETLRRASAISAAAAMREETGFFVMEDMEKLLPQIEIKKL